MNNAGMRMFFEWQKKEQQQSRSFFEFENEWS